MRFGRNFMCFYNDALTMNKYFGMPVHCWGKRPFVNVWDNSYPLFVK
jgi:hypothetical protein